MSFIVPYLLDGAEVEPLTPAFVESSMEVPGPAWGNALTPRFVDSRAEAWAPVFPPPADLLRPITPAFVQTSMRVPGPMIGGPPDPQVPAVPVGDGFAPYEMTVAGYPEALSFSCQPQINGKGAGTVTIKRQPGDLVPGEVVGFNLLGNRVFSGLVTERSDVELDQGEEADETVTVKVPGMLTEWDYAIVYPDFGAQDVARLGPPTQDIRVFDWTMNGLGTDDAEGVAGVNITDSIAMSNRYGQDDEVFPLPDVWPAPYARWMWASDPSNLHQPAGWCYFREPFGASEGKMQVWCCAYDYAEVWMDGVPLLTCDQPGVAQHIEIDVRADFHLITIRAHNGGGKAGVLCALMPVDESTGLYGEPYRLSGGGWKTLAYPSRTFRLNPAQVLRRLRLEARSRGVKNFDLWSFDFNETYDSAGRPWPPGEPFAFEVGMTYFEVLERMAEDRVDYAAVTGRKLSMWVKDRGTGTDMADPWAPDQYDSYVTEQVVR